MFRQLRCVGADELYDAEANRRKAIIGPARRALLTTPILAQSYAISWLHPGCWAREAGCCKGPAAPPQTGPRFEDLKLPASPTAFLSRPPGRFAGDRRFRAWAILAR